MVVKIVYEEGEEIHVGDNGKRVMPYNVEFSVSIKRLNHEFNKNDTQGMVIYANWKMIE